MAKKNINEMSFLDHLEDLRWHLIRICLAVIIVATVVFIFSRFVFDSIIFAPLDMGFPPTTCCVVPEILLELKPRFAQKKCP